MTIERCREKVEKLQRRRTDLVAAIAELSGVIARL